MFAWAGEFRCRFGGEIAPTPIDPGVFLLLLGNPVGVIQVSLGGGYVAHWRPSRSANAQKANSRARRPLCSSGIPRLRGVARKLITLVANRSHRNFLKDFDVIIMINQFQLYKKKKQEDLLIPPWATL